MKIIYKQVGEYLDYCEKVRGMTSATMCAKRNILERFVRTTELKDIRALNNDIFNRWVKNEVGRGVSARSINTYNAAILAMVNYCRGVGMSIPIKMSLIGKLKEGKIRRNFYTAAEINKVLSFADRKTGLMIKIMFETGMRIAEITNLRLCDISGRRIRFVGKGRKQREVYIKEETRQELERFIILGEIKDYIWGCYEKNGASGEPPTTGTVRKYLKKPFVMAGFEDFYPHALRHSFATNLQMNGAGVGEIKEMIGHESVATTERYLHGFEGRLEELFDKYS